MKNIFKNDNIGNKQVVASLFVIGLILMVISASYAMYVFTGTGTKENVITTGQITVAFEEKNNILIKNRYPETDAEGLANTDANSQMTFTVSSDITGDATINYAIGLTDIVEGATLKQDHIKIYLTKNGSVASGFTENEGKTIKTFKDYSITNYLDSHVLTQGSVTGTQTDTYTLKAWIDEKYDLPATNTSSSNIHSNTTTTETFSFKLKAIGTDEVLEFVKNEVLACDEIPEEKTNANAPVLASNMIPVCYNSAKDVWLKADSTNTDSDYRWYSYSGKTWANAITVKDVLHEIGTIKNNQAVTVLNDVLNKTYYKSTNGGVKYSNSSSIFKFTAGSSGTYSFDWSVSSEALYDKLIIRVNGTIIPDAFDISGVKSGTYTAEAINGETYTIEVLYKKDSSGDKNDDMAIIGNFILPEGSTEITNTVNDTYPTYPWESYTKLSFSLNIYSNYTIENGKFVLSDKIIEGDIIGKYICSDGISKTCNEIYKVVEYNDMVITKVDQYSDIKSIARNEYLNVPVGTEIPMEYINTMFVWIPRFSAVGDTANYNGGTIDAPGAFNITFVNKEDVAHDAFNFGGAVSGFWIGKFEISHSTLSLSTASNNLKCGTETCENANGIEILPNKRPLRNNGIKSFFYASKSMTQSGNPYGFDKKIDTTLDIHMLKNNEWGAVAYLTQSIYGRCINLTSCTEVGINNNPSLGMDASTTGNIYGVYDMSGGSSEHVMGNYNNSIGSSGFFTGLPDAKYYNVYTTESDYMSSGLQHAMTETSGWYGDEASFVSTNNSWFNRGGFTSSVFQASEVGLFNFTETYGGVDDSCSTHFSVIIN